DPIHNRFGEPEDGDEEGAHDEGEDEEAPDAMKKDRIDAGGENGLWGVVELVGRRDGRALGDDVFDPEIVGLDVGLHGVEAEGSEAALGGGQDRGDFFIFDY